MSKRQAPKRSIPNKEDAALTATVVVASSRPKSSTTRNGTPSERAAFARRLAKEMEAQELNASRLAGAVWGWQDSLIRGKSYRTARNRDRMSSYLAGKSYPRPEALKKIAEALNVAPEDLAPEVLTMGWTPPARVKISPASGPNSAGHYAIEVNAIVPSAVALSVAGRLAELGLSASLELRADGQAGLIFAAVVPQGLALSIGRDLQDVEALDETTPANRAQKRTATKLAKSR